MCEIMQEIKNSGIAEGKRQLILQMYHDGDINLTTACKRLNLSTDDFLILEKEHNAYAI